MILKIFVKGPIDANNYLLIDEKTNDAVLIDCSSSEDEFVNQIKELGVNLKFILLTHGHFDHIGGCDRFREEFGVDVYVGKDDIEQIRIAPDMTERISGFRVPATKKVNKTISDGDVFHIGDITLKAISTPGHTKGGICYLSNDGKLFSGDTLFQRSVGRTDLEFGNFEEILYSVKEKLFNLPDDTVVYPGHGPTTIIEKEKKFNEIVKM